MAVVQTAGAPPTCGKTTFVNSGCTKNSSDADRKIVVQNRAGVSHRGMWIGFADVSAMGVLWVLSPSI